MDREKVTKSSSQIGFIKYVLLPLFEALGTLLPVIEVSFCRDFNIISFCIHVALCDLVHNVEAIHDPSLGHCQA